VGSGGSETSRRAGFVSIKSHFSNELECFLANVVDLVSSGKTSVTGKLASKRNIDNTGKQLYTGNMTESEILVALKTNEPLKGLPNVRIENLVPLPDATGAKFDAKFDLRFGETKVEVYAEIKNSCTPKQVEQIAPWLSRFKATQKDAAFALVCPALSPQSQTLCLERNVDFIDLAGNVYINVPGKLLLQRVGMEPQRETGPSFYRNPFSGKSSRVLRVLLEDAKKPWTLSGITEELAAQTRSSPCAGVSFEVSSSLVSRVLRSLEEELLIMRRNGTILVPEPGRLLTRWLQEYGDRYRWYLRGSFKLPNPFGSGLQAVKQGIDGLLKPQCYAFTSAAAASLTAPFVDVDPIDLYVSDEAGAENLRGPISGASVGPDIRIIQPFDAGVFMYSSLRDGLPVVSDIQTCLDLFGRGGRDLEQAAYLRQRIEASWRTK